MLQTTRECAIHRGTRVVRAAYTLVRAGYDWPTHGQGSLRAYYAQPMRGLCADCPQTTRGRRARAGNVCGTLRGRHGGGCPGPRAKCARSPGKSTLTPPPFVGGAMCNKKQNAAPSPILAVHVSRRCAERHLASCSPHRSERKGMLRCSSLHGRLVLQRLATSHEE